MKQWFNEKGRCGNFSEIVINLMDNGHKMEGSFRDLMEELDKDNTASISGKPISMGVLRNVDYVDVNYIDTYRGCKNHATVVVSNGGKIHIILDACRYQNVMENGSLKKLLPNVKEDDLSVDKISELANKIGGSFDSVWVVDYRQ